MGGKKSSPAPVEEKPVTPIPPAVDPNAMADAKSANNAASASYASSTEEAMKKQQKEKAGLGSTSRDPASIANQSNALSSSAVITG